MNYYKIALLVLYRISKIFNYTLKSAPVGKRFQNTEIRCQKSEEDRQAFHSSGSAVSDNSEESGSAGGSVSAEARLLDCLAR